MTVIIIVFYNLVWNICEITYGVYQKASSNHGNENPTSVLKTELEYFYSTLHTTRARNITWILLRKKDARKKKPPGDITEDDVKT